MRIYTYNNSPIRSAFTLIELLVVVAIIALLISILLPALSAAREQGKSAVCMSNLRQIGVGVRLYADDNNGMMPPNLLWSQYEPYLLHVNPGSVRNLGYLHAGDYVRQAKVYYCPSMNMSSHMLHTQDNPWWEWVENWDTYTTDYTRSSYYYYVRYENVFWNRQRLFYARQDGIADDYRQYHRQYDDIPQMAIVSDSVYSPEAYAHDSRNGFNVLFADGHVSFWQDTERDYEQLLVSGELSADQVYIMFDEFDLSF